MALRSQNAFTLQIGIYTLCSNQIGALRCRAFTHLFRLQVIFFDTYFTVVKYVIVLNDWVCVCVWVFFVGFTQEQRGYNKQPSTIKSDINFPNGSW